MPDQSASLEIRLIDANDGQSPAVGAPPVTGVAPPPISPIQTIAPPPSSPMGSPPPMPANAGSPPAQLDGLKSAASSAAIELRTFEGAVGSATDKLKEQLDKLVTAGQYHPFNFRIDSGPSPTATQGAAPPATRSGEDKAGDRLQKSMETAARTFEKTVASLFTIIESLNALERSEANSIVRERNTILARVNSTQANIEIAAKAAIPAGAAGGAAAGTAMFGPAGTVPGAIAGGSAAYYSVKAIGEAITHIDKKFLEFRDALAERSQSFAPYNGALAGAMAGRQNASRQMDISEAALFGPDFAEFTKAQSQLDLEMRRATQLAMLKDIKDNTKQANEHATKIRKANEEVLKHMSAETRRKFEEAEKNRKDPLTDFLGGLTVPDDPRAKADDAMKKRRDAEANGPVFGG